MTRPCTGVLLAALGLAACGEEPVVDDLWGGTIEVRDGVTWVLNPAEDPELASDAPPFTLHLEQTFGAEEVPAAALLAWVTGVAVDSEGTVYVVDKSNNRIVAFAANGEMLWAGGREGEGPGEFAQPQRIAWSEENLLYVDNQSGTRVAVWTTDGVHVEDQVLGAFDVGRAWIVGMASPHTLVMDGFSRTDGDGALVHVFDLTEGWHRTAEFFALGGRAADTDVEALWDKAQVSVSDESIWIGNMLNYETREYGLDGGLRRVVAREHRPVVPVVLHRGTAIRLGAFGAPVWLRNGFGLLARYRVPDLDDGDAVRRQWDAYLDSGRDEAEAIRYRSAIDLLDADGRVLGSMHMDGYIGDVIGTLAVVGPDGRLYTAASEPYPQVRRYRVEIPGALGAAS